MSTSEPRGIGGWLLLVVIGLVLTPVRIFWLLSQEILPVFTDGHWELLTDSLSAAYHPLWGPVIVFEVAGNLALAGASIAALVLGFKHSALFPRWMIGIYLGGFVFIAVDSLLGRSIPAVAAQDDPSRLNELARSALTCAIWVPYMIRSRRVRNTFSASRADTAPRTEDPRA